MTDPYHGFDPEFAAASDWARLYRANGVQIVPCKNKIPRLKSWKEYQNCLVPDAQFEAWYGHNGEFSQSYDMGMLTGLASGRILMIDLDIYKSGGHLAIQWWQNVLAVHNHGLDLETWKQHTGGGGVQMFFLYPQNWKFAVNAKTAINVDVRCQGGFAVLPPTQHASGRPYEWDPGCAPWELDLAAAPDWLLEEVEQLVREHGGGTFGIAGNGQNVPREHIGNGQFDAFGHKIDGRETAMRDMVWRVVLDWNLENPLPVPAVENTRKAQHEYEVYERNTRPQKPHPADMTLTQMLDAEGRGWVVWWDKWQRAMAQWDGRVYEEARRKDRPKSDDPKPDFTEEYAKAKDQNTDVGNIFPFFDIDQIMDKPDPVWVVDGIINERALGFIFGPPSSLKTFIALDLALSMAARLPHWWDRGISRHGAVVYLCREGTSSFKFRIKAWEIHRKCAAKGQPFFLIEHPCNFLDGSDVGKAVTTIKTIMAKAGVPVAAVIVDTVSRVLPGAEENLQKDMTKFVYACEMIQLEFQCIVIGVHHTNKNGGIRGSSVIPGAGDFLLETRRETGFKTGTMVLQKVKDGEDGIEIPFKFTKYEGLGTFGDKSSLVVDPDGDAKPASVAEPGGNLPDMTVCREILAALAQAWFNKMPWCKSANGARPAMTMIMNRWMLKRDVAKRLLDGWVANGIIDDAFYDKRNKLRGYRKVIDL